MKKEQVLVMEPGGWAEVELILEGKSILPIKEQAFFLWFADEIIQEFLEHPADVKKMSRETGLSTKGREAAESLHSKVKTKLSELERRIEEEKGT